VRRVIPFSEIQAGDVVGGKAKNLARLYQSHFPVPKGFVITTDAFELIIQGNQNSNLWVFPALLRQEIEAAYKAYVQPPVAVRSSCSAEDLGQSSFAGQYESILNVTSLNLLESIKRCLLSVYEGHTQSYLTQRFSAVETPAMSVIVQELVDADIAGVVFSKNPITGSEDKIVINASFGLGEAIVSGLVTPDFYVLPKQGPTFITRELGEKECKTVLDQHGTRLTETTAEEKSSFSLRDEQLHELKEVAMAIETLFGHPVDLEFAYRRGKLHILQARPITT